MTQTIRCYTDLSKFNTIQARYEYLKLSSQVGRQTFGWDRRFNQDFYHSREWRRVRDYVIVRDEGYDLGVSGYEVGGKILIHHMNPIWIGDLRQGNPDILNPEYLISVSNQTHQAIHYGDVSLLPSEPILRLPGDTKLW